MVRRSTLHFLILFVTFFSFVEAMVSQNSTVLSASNSRHHLFLKNGEATYLLNDLLIGRQYTLQTTDFLYESADCLPSLPNTTNLVVLQEDSYYRLYQFRAIDTTLTLALTMDCLPDTSAIKEVLVSVSCMDCPPTAQSRSMAGIEITQNDDAEHLIRDVFIGGNCFDVNNITKKGNREQFGIFSNATLGVGKVEYGGLLSRKADVDLLSDQEGIILSTGLAIEGKGPNNSNETGERMSANATDSDLAKLLTGQPKINDAVILEFDFTPTTEEVSFEYVFASEEYCEYVNEPYNDVFGFFLSGPGINGPFSNGAINIARIPGSSEHVSINAVNFEATNEYYIKNAPPFGSLFKKNCTVSEQLKRKPVEDLIEYDGLTTTLTAVARVIPCETYHIKLAIGDVTDGVYDSAVLLKANSFNAGGNATANVNVPDAVDPTAGIAFEGCQDASIIFSRTENDMSEPLTVTFSISDSSTAVVGQDFLPFPNSIVIPRGQMTASLPIVTIDDDIDETIESIILDLDQACSCETKEVEMFISEPLPIDLTLDDVVTCEGGEVFLRPKREGGVGRVTHEWSNGVRATSITETITEATSYTVTVTDQCEVTAAATANITIDEQTATLTGTKRICNGEADGDIQVAFTGSIPWDLTYTINGEEQTITGITEKPFSLPTEEAGIYQIIQAASGGCTATSMGEATLQISELSIDAAITHPTCFNTNDGNINLTIGGSGQNLQYEWSDGSTEKNITEGNVGLYSVSITDNINCLFTKDSMELVAPPEITANIVAETVVNCAQTTIAAPKITIEGGTPGHVFTILDEVGNAVETEAIGAGNYTVHITDAMGCTLAQSFMVQADTTQPTAKVGGKNNLSCEVVETNLSGIGSSEEIGRYTYLWTTAGGSFVSGANSLTPIINAPGTYTLVVTDTENGCQAMASEVVLANYEQPEISVEQPSLLNCRANEVTIQGTVVMPVDNYTMTWLRMSDLDTIDKNTLSPTVNMAGEYQLVVKNEENGCKDSVTVVVEENLETPELDIIDNPILNCEQTSITLTTNVLNVEEDSYGFSWKLENPDGVIANRNTLSPVVNMPGIYELTVDNKSNFCQTTAQINVLLDTIAPLASAGESFVFTCNVASAIIQGEANNGEDYRYLWSTENGFIHAGETTLTPSIQKAGNYELLVTSRINGCTATSSVQVMDDPNRPVINIAPPADLNCINTSIPLNVSIANIGVSMEYTWTTADGNLLDINNPMRPMIDKAGTYQLQVTDTELNCTGTAEAIVTLDTVAPIAKITTPEEFNCHTTALQLDGTGSSKGDDFQYAWNTSDGTIQSGQTTLFPMVSDTGTYELLITSLINGCTKEQSIHIQENVPRIAQVEKADPPCFDETGSININTVEGGVGPYRYSINEGANYQDSNIFDRVQPGTYRISIMDNNDCELQEEVQIIAPEVIDIELSAEQKLTLGDSTRLNTIVSIPDSEIADIVWSPANGLSCDDCLQPIAKPTSSQTYEVQLLDINGCEANTSVNFLVDASPNVFLPTAFSPNNEDGVNDRFTVFAKASSVRNVRTLRIFDRWGTLVFERNNFSPNDPSLGWDGRFNNQPLRPQVFVYFAEVEMINNRVEMIKGDVALME